MSMRPVATALLAVALAMTGAQPASAHESGTPNTAPRSVQAKRWTKLAGTLGHVNDGAGAVRLASYSLVSGAGQRLEGYLRVGDRFVRTPYREAVVSPGQRWVAAVRGHRVGEAARSLDLIDRRTGVTHTITMPAAVTSPEWSPDGRRVLLTAYQRRRGGGLTVIGFVVMDVADREPRLVRTEPRSVAHDREVGREYRFFFAGRPDRVLRKHSEREGTAAGSLIAVYDLRGRPAGRYAGVGVPDGRSAAPLFSPSRRLFATVVRHDRGARAEIRIVNALTGRVLGRIGDRDVRGFAGWYDDEHIIVKRERGRTALFQRADLSGRADLDLIRERLVLTGAEFKPRLDRVYFVRRG